MRKLVLGIIAVVCVQFAFVIYTQLQLPLDLAIEPVFNDLSMADNDLTWTEELDRYGMTVPEPERSAVRNATLLPMKTESAPRVTESIASIARVGKPRFTRPRAFRPARPTIHFRPAPQAAASDFETVVISYNRAPVFPDCIRYYSPKPRKRSYIARVLPVVKKPWGWMKSVGARLY